MGRVPRRALRGQGAQEEGGRAVGIPRPIHLEPRRALSSRSGWFHDPIPPSSSPPHPVEDE